jgi:hypothetical protein
MISIDAFKVSWLYKEGFADGVAHAKTHTRAFAEGYARGLVKGRLDALRIILQHKFPSEQFPEIAHLNWEELLNFLTLSASEAETPEQARRAIAAFVPPANSAKPAQ